MAATGVGQTVVNVFFPNFMDEERKFHMTLHRLCGVTSSVTVDYIFEALGYISNKSVIEAQFIEEAYLGNIFDNETFLVEGKISICSLQYLMNRYTDAVKSNDHDFLRLLRQAHRQARSFLEADDVKARIREVIIQRQKNIERRAVWTAFTNIMGLLQYFPSARFSTVLQPLLPQLLNTVEAAPAIEGGDNRNITFAANEP